MCISPNKVPNPYYKHNLHNLYKRNSYLHDTQSQYIYIPCGVCKECIALKQMYLVQRVQMESFNSFLFFSTLTYNDDMLPHYTFSNGVSVPFADTLHLQMLFRRLRDNNVFGRPFRYLAVSERGSKKGRPHFHILWFLPRYDSEDYIDGLGLQSHLYKSILENWVVPSNQGRYCSYTPLCTFKQKFRNGKLFSNYDTHFVTPSLTSDGISSVAFYVCKYMMKQNDKERRLQQAMRLNLPEDEYETAFPIVKSKSLRSQYFGLRMTDSECDLQVVNYLRDCVRRSKGISKFPMFYSPDSHNTFPLSPYFKRFPFIYSLKDHLDFKMDDDSLFVDFDKSFTQCKNAIDSFNRVQSLVDSKDLSLEFNFLFD